MATTEIALVGNNMRANLLYTSATNYEPWACVGSDLDKEKNAMKTLVYVFAFFALALLLVSVPASRRSSAAAGGQGGDKLVYADFEKMENNRPVSARGGWMQLENNQENPGNPAKFTGMKETNNAPELVHLNANDPNKVAMFNYELKSPNNYATVTLSIHGQPDKDGKPVPDDVSGYSNISLQVYAKGTPGPTGVQAMRVELISRGQGVNLQWGFPQKNFKLSAAGFNTYKIPLKSLAQPFYAPARVDAKDVLKKLTEVQISVFCEGGCTPINGTVVVDNVVFSKD